MKQPKIKIEELTTIDPEAQDQLKAIAKEVQEQKGWQSGRGIQNSSQGSYYYTR